MSEAITYRNLAELRTSSNNYRQGDVGAIVQSILTFGFNGVLRVWKDGVVKAGNHSLLALQSIKASGLPIPTHIKAQGNDWLVPCIDISHLSETAANAFMVADNRLTELAQNDEQRLAELLTEIASEDAKLLQAVGYDGDDLDELLRGLADTGLKGGDDTPQVDKADELQKQWQTSHGQLWQLGKHRLLIDDCTIEANVKRLMDGKKADAVVTDPPYGIGVDKSMHEKGGQQYGNAAAPKKHYAATDWDSAPPSKVVIDWLSSFAPQAIIWGGNYFELPPARCYLVWDKQNDGNQFADCELAWTTLDKPVRLIRHLWNGMLREGKEERLSHPTQKPLAVIVWAINQLEKQADIIFDAYCGTGTTLIACEQLNRTCYGCEIDPKYGAVILDRWQTLTGLTPKLVTL